MKQMTPTHRSKKDKFLQSVNNSSVIGAIITWHPGNKEQPFAAVKAALKHAQLDEAVAGERRPRDAFSRACKILETERVIDLFKEEGEDLVYQFTGKLKMKDEIKHKRETFVRINRITGKVSCPITQIETFAQQELDRMMEVRTTSDITKIVQKLFDRQAEMDGTMLFSIRDQGGAYYVDQQFMGFVRRIQTFLQAMGGDVNEFPIANTPTGQQSVQGVVEEGLESLVLEHEKAIETFGVNTHGEALKRAVDKVKSTKIKIEAYASSLGSMRETLLKSLENANKKLVKKVEEITKQKSERFAQNTNGDVGIDAWGSKIGTNHNLANKVLCDKPKTMSEIMSEAKLSDTVYIHMKKMIEAGRVVKIGKGFKLAEGVKGV